MTLLACSATRHAALTFYIGEKCQGQFVNFGRTTSATKEISRAINNAFNFTEETGFLLWGVSVEEPVFLPSLQDSHFMNTRPILTQAVQYL